jgi:hypothetical protein
MGSPGAVALLQGLPSAPHLGSFRVVLATRRLQSLTSRQTSFDESMISKGLLEARPQLDAMIPSRLMG